MKIIPNDVLSKSGDFYFRDNTFNGILTGDESRLGSHSAYIVYRIDDAAEVFELIELYPSEAGRILANGNFKKFFYDKMTPNQKLILNYLGGAK